jgi:hypothetical protein
LILCRHEFYQAIDEIVDVAERPRLRTVSVDCQISVEQSLNDEI